MGTHSITEKLLGQDDNINIENDRLSPARIRFEAGRLLVCASDLDKILEYPEGRQFYKALLDYLRQE